MTVPKLDKVKKIKELVKRLKEANVKESQEISSQIKKLCDEIIEG